MACNNEAIKKFVQKIIDENIIAVFSKTECPYCIKAISILKGYNVSNMHVEQIEKNPNMADIQAYLKDLTGEGERRGKAPRAPEETGPPQLNRRKGKNLG
ncbi:glutaredoxin [Plasmodium vivax India VII]|uniref:Glutaredoxin-1 n=5 Tax=Plasmodium vivax TaxID=5855 RepID=A5KB80_PLAVS|nr:glutaredoxin, putative [Plasmodium vivax]KMZ80728.1 glutaredoxin [Plasmodium vivax India VII]KMZ86805.1 glutaredoxin [Plasmodium vivax Brazil I]KMZ93632.1 glutaredoxin [Plasmodium vivax Mauritania I]KMZ99873.1 glutaredoxin [Plasmodium vivax North Korean]EDL43358.1 glutaredoxin, putative [Plasmodium vivax]|eukprot:XP_001613085.1 glutaredoxin [Plasmodium vivax Sal-1]